MFVVVKTNESYVPEVSGDEHVPLMIRWGLRPCVYARLVWPDGRICCEFKLDRVTGQVVGVTLLNLPLVADVYVEGSGVWAEEGVPVLDMAPFDLNPDLEPRAAVVDLVTEASHSWGPAFYVIWFFDGSIERWVQSGPVGFAINAREQLVALRLAVTALPSAGKLARR